MCAQADLDGNGHLDMDELRSIMKKPQFAETAMQNLDTNMDGRVSIREWLIASEWLIGTNAIAIALVRLCGVLDVRLCGALDVRRHLPCAAVHETFVKSELACKTALKMHEKAITTAREDKAAAS